MNYWLLKTEPHTFSWEELKAKTSEPWDGVRNYQARNFMKDMKKGDLCFIYHSGDEKAIQGIATCVNEHYPDPTTDDPAWVCIDIAFFKDINRKISLKELKANPEMKGLLLLTHSRLSVMPVNEDIWNKILSL